MKRTAGVVAMVAVVVLAAAGAAGAEELRGRFVERVEREHGDGEFLGMVVQLPEEKGRVTLLVPRRREDLARLVQRLREGQIVEITYVVEGGAKWVRTVEAAGRAQPERGESEEVERLLRRLIERIERLEREVRELRQQREREGRERADRREGDDAVKRVERREGDREGDRDRERADREREGDRERTEREREGAREHAEREHRDREHAEREGDREHAEREGDREHAEREREGERERGDEAAEGRGVVRGRFVRLAEKKLGRVEHLAVVVQPEGRDATVTLFVPMHRTERGWARDERIAGLARKLRAGQGVEVVWRRAEGQRFIVNIEW